MKAASAQEIKQALKALDQKALLEICLRLARHKKENKELLTFLLFEADDIPAYIKAVNEQIEEGFNDMNDSTFYLARKSIRKILRDAGKYIRYSGNKTVEIEVLLQFCNSFKTIKASWQKAPALANLYAAQLKKAAAAIEGLHEDLQYDYRSHLDDLSQ